MTDWIQRRETLLAEREEAKAAVEAARSEAVEALAVGDTKRWEGLFSSTEEQGRYLSQIEAALASVDDKIAAEAAEAEARRKADHLGKAEAALAERAEAGKALDEGLLMLNAVFARYVQLGSEYRDEIRAAGGRVDPYAIAPDVGLAAGFARSAPEMAAAIFGDLPGNPEPFETLALSIRVNV